MRAVVYKGPKEVAVEEVDDPKIENPRDAIIKLTSTAICGSDLQMYDGRKDKMLKIKTRFRFLYL